MYGACVSDVMRLDETGAAIAGRTGLLLSRAERNSSCARLFSLDHVGHQSPPTACPPSAARPICSGVNQSRLTEPMLMNHESRDGAFIDGW